MAQLDEQPPGDELDEQPPGDQEVAGSAPPGRPHSFMEIYHGICSTVIL